MNKNTKDDKDDKNTKEHIIKAERIQGRLLRRGYITNLINSYESY